MFSPQGDLLRVVQMHPSGWLEVDTGFISPHWVSKKRPAVIMRGIFFVFPTLSILVGSPIFPRAEASENELPLPEIPLPQTYLPEFQAQTAAAAAASSAIVGWEQDPRPDPVVAQVRTPAHMNPAWIEVVIRRPGTERLGLAIVGGLETSQKQKVRGIVVKEVRLLQKKFFRVFLTLGVTTVGVARWTCSRIGEIRQRRSDCVCQ
jgi:hypothetical protein